MLREKFHPACYLTQSQYTDTGSTNPRTDPVTPDAKQGTKTNIQHFPDKVNSAELPSMNEVL